MEKYDNNTRTNFHVCGRNFMLPARVSPQTRHLTQLLVPLLLVHPVLLPPQHPYPEYSLPQVLGPTATPIMVVTETETETEIGNARKTANVLIASASGKFGIVSVSNAIASVTALLKFVTRSASRLSV
jgi:hypothetical protein